MKEKEQPTKQVYKHINPYALCPVRMGFLFQVCFYSSNVKWLCDLQETSLNS